MIGCTIITYAGDNHVVQVNPVGRECLAPSQLCANYQRGVSNMRAQRGRQKQSGRCFVDKLENGQARKLYLTSASPPPPTEDPMLSTPMLKSGH